MNPTNDHVSQGDDQRFDLLVDGELSETERRELLAGLDEEPGGWRRCALAFLEAQVWKEDLGSILPKPAGQPAPRRLSRRSWPGGYSGTLLAMAASFLVALFLGLVLRGAWRSSIEGSPSPWEIAENAPEAKGPVQRPDRPEDVGPQTLPRPDSPSGRWQMVDLSVPGGAGGESRSIRLPAIERDHLDEDWLRSLPAAIPPEVLSELERGGHRVDRHRELFPFRLPDGRQLVVPVDQVDIHYVGNPAL